MLQLVLRKYDSALGPHDGRLADLIALGRHTEGKLGDALRTLAPDGSAQNAYINYLTNRSDEAEAEGHFKSVLDGFGANLVFTPVMHAAALVLKQGTFFLRSGVEAGVRKFSDLSRPEPLNVDALGLGKVRIFTGNIRDSATLRKGDDKLIEAANAPIAQSQNDAH